MNLTLPKFLKPSEPQVEQPEERTKPLRTIVCPVPPREEDCKRVLIETKDKTKVELTVALAKAQGYLDFTTDDRGFITSITDRSGEPTCPDNAISVSPLWLQHKHQR